VPTSSGGGETVSASVRIRAATRRKVNDDVNVALNSVIFHSKTPHQDRLAPIGRNLEKGFTRIVLLTSPTLSK